MRRAFKVATSFTGAVACTAAFTPAAGAATTTMGKGAPRAFARNCTIGTSTTSVHFYWLPSAHHGPTCVGEAGTVSLHGIKMSAFCAGNNFGYFYANGHKLSFFSGSTFELFSAKITQVHISGWGGSSKCFAG